MPASVGEQQDYFWMSVWGLGNLYMPSFLDSLAATFFEIDG